MELFLELLIALVVEFIPSIFRGLGAAIRWMYFRKKHSYREVLKMEGNLAVGLFVFVPIIAIYILYMAVH